MSEIKQDGGENRPEGPTGPSGGELFDAVLGWNTRFFRTIFDSLVRPVKVARAALESDTTEYASALRLFIFLYGLMMGLTALIGGAAITSLETQTGATPEQLAHWLAGTPHAMPDIESSLSFWTGIMVWPITAISSSFYILLLKAYAPNRTLYGHLLIYLITNNGAMGIQVLLLITMAPWADLMTAALVSLAALFIIFLVITARVIFAMYSKTILGGAMKFLGVLVLTPISMLISGLLQFLFVAAYLQISYDLSVFQLLAIQAGDAS